MASTDADRLRVGLTGGVASGKSTVAKLFAERGVPVVDADAIARTLTEPGSPALDAVIEVFGEGILGTNGRLDRAGLRQLVFEHPERRRELEAILHPRILSEMVERAREAEGAYVVFEIPLLVEQDLANTVDRVLVVDCPESVQIRRLIERDGETAESAKAILNAQATRDDRLKAADDVLVNDGERDELAPWIEKLDRFYRELDPQAAPTRPGLRLPP